MENLINLQQEIWTDIVGFENYEISNYGKIRNKLNYKILKQSLDRHGYYFVSLRKNDKYQYQSVHRLIAFHYIPYPLLAKYVDHIDNNQKNNSISNLRWATYQQNSMNLKKHKNSTSQFKGVSFFNKVGKWQAQIKLNGKSIHLGLFTNEKDAAIAYDIQAIQHFGEFAKTNFPRENYQQEEGKEEDQFQTGN